MITAATGGLARRFASAGLRVTTAGLTLLTLVFWSVATLGTLLHLRQLLLAGPAAPGSGPPPVRPTGGGEVTRDPGLRRRRNPHLLGVRSEGRKAALQQRSVEQHYASLGMDAGEQEEG